MLTVNDSIKETDLETISLYIIQLHGFTEYGTKKCNDIVVITG